MVKWRGGLFTGRAHHCRSWRRRHHVVADAPVEEVRKAASFRSGIRVGRAHAGPERANLLDDGLVGVRGSFGVGAPRP